MAGIENLRDTIVPKSDQLNADDLVAGPVTITVERVKRSSAPDQPLDVMFGDETGKAYRPCKTMRKILIFAWGENGAEWVGKSMTLFCDPSVKWGGVKVGGIRISHLSHIESDISVMLAETKGKKTQVNIKRLKTEKQAPDFSGVLKALEVAAGFGMDELKSAWSGLDTEVRKSISPKGCPENLKEIAINADAQKGSENA